VVKRPPSVAGDIHATSARRFHPSAVQPIAAAVSRELAIYDVKTRPSLAAKANHSELRAPGDEQRTHELLPHSIM